MDGCLKIAVLLVRLFSIANEFACQLFWWSGLEVNPSYIVTENTGMYKKYSITTLGYLVLYWKYQLFP